MAMARVAARDMAIVMAWTMGRVMAIWQWLELRLGK